MPPVTRFDTERFSRGVVPLPYENIAIAQSIVAIALIINLTIRCPNCGKHLTLSKYACSIPHYCPDCGTAITDERTVE